MSEILAKSSKKYNGNPIRLCEHTKDVLETFNVLKSRMNSPDLSEIIRLAIICHDWGKVLPAFQIKKLGNRQYQPFDIYHDIDHSLVSVLWIDQDKLEEQIKKFKPKEAETYRQFVLSAVAYHHWRKRFLTLLQPDSMEFQNLSDKLLGDSKFLESLKQNLLAEVNQIQGADSLIGFNYEMAKGLKNGVPFSEYAHPPYQLYWLPRRVEIEEHKLRDWILISGFLMRSDHFASFCEEEGERYNPEHQSVAPPKLKENVKAKINQTDEKKIWQFQEVDCCKDKNVILIAPTGYGKTEFAFLWSNGEKFFYTLPLRAAVNQIFERARAIFKDTSSDEKVGLLHSDADVYLLGDGGEAQANLKAYDLARQLAHPVLISTGDQFFPYALRPPGYEKIYATFSHSRLVIDEVQSYDPRAAAIVVKFMEDVVRMGGRFLLMTATLPKFVKDEVNRVIGEENYAQLNLYEGVKSQFEQIKKHHIKVELIENTINDGKLDFIIPDYTLEEVLNQAKAGKRVLVIANTVKQAQDIFSRLDKLIKQEANYASLKDKLWLLHSRFAQADRSQLETKICGDKATKRVGEFQNPKPDSEKEGKILVATQVVEASLDIDADVLFTEIAPLDALVQRMGRVWRRYGPMEKPEEIPKSANPNVYVWVFKHGLHSGQHYVYDNDLILLTLKLLKDISANQCKESYKEWLAKKGKEKAGERIRSVVEEVFGSQESPQKKARGRKRSKSKDVNLVAASGPQGFQVTLSEYDKFELVEKLYDLPDDHDYMTKFTQAKDILDAGYMSDQLNEAHKIFREIYTVSVIPSQAKENFRKDVRQFWEKHRDEKRLYTYFKKEVLARFVVQIPLNLRKLEGRGLQPIEWWVRDLPGINKQQKERLLRWCQDIYFAEYEYDRKKGIMVDEPWGHKDAAII